MKKGEKKEEEDEAEDRLAVDEEGLTAGVSDRGPGFEQAQVRPELGRHVGLGLLRERARLAGGSLVVDSRTVPPGESGTVLTLRLPWSAVSDATPERLAG